MTRTALSAASTAATVALVLLATHPAHAQDPRELFTQGQAAYETGDYETAVESWQRAYGIDPRPLLQYNLAQAYERLGQLDRAVEAYRLYVDNTAGDDPRAQNARARIASLEQRVGNTSVHVSGGPEGAAVFIDGEDRGRLPHPDPFRVGPGSHRIVVRADGYEDFVSVVAVSAGQQAEVPVEMREGASGGASTSGGGGGISTIGIAIAAGGGAVMVAGAITGGLALSAAGDAPSSDGSQADEARTLALVTDILIPVGAAVAVTGVILMFVLGEDGGGDSASVTPVVGPDSAGVAATGRF
ncbi:MAG TPA: tetratricopeptide repeat protein [Sandaracinaceae bacterium LLY-WYZ-13_1]|nr:tetratricopeptide repeat protein [Sandaracinaceae bacterium LLY-WYZ-13_1]